MRLKSIISRSIATLLLSAFAIMGAGCSNSVVRSYTPNSEEEASQYGMVGFGLYIYSPKEKNLMNVISSSSGTFYTNIKTPYITIEEVVSIDKNKKILITKPIDNSSEITKEDELSNEFIEKKFAETTNFYTLVSTKPGKRYVITELAYTFRKASSKGLLTTVVRRFPIDPYKSFEAMPIESIGGKINFLGTFMASIIITKKDDPYGVDDPNPSLKELLDNNLVTMKLQKADSFIRLQRSDNLRDKYYGDLRVTPETMEMHFLNEIIPFYEGTLWEKYAKARLKELNPM